MKALKRAKVGNRSATVFRTVQNGKPVYCVLLDQNGKIQIPSVYGAFGKGGAQ
jgi:hypothetical protein